MNSSQTTPQRVRELSPPRQEQGRGAKDNIYMSINFSYPRVMKESSTQI